MSNVLCAEWDVWGASEPVRDAAINFRDKLRAKTKPQTRRL